MRFNANITLTEEDYREFNYFHTFQTKYGKKAVKQGRILFLACIAILSALIVMLRGWSFFSLIYVIMIVIFSAIYMLLYKRHVAINVDAQIKRLKKLGKLPYSPAATLEFYEDTFVEITPGKRVEQSYDKLERICIQGERYIFLYDSTVTAYMLPIPQLKTQLNVEELIHFLTQKHNTVEHF